MGELPPRPPGGGGGGGGAASAGGGVAGVSAVGGAVVFPPPLLRALSDKLYDKRKAAAVEVENIVKHCVACRDSDQIYRILHLLINDYAFSPQSNFRKGGLIGLAAVTVGLADESGAYLERIVPPVLRLFTDQEGRVRYYACESLYNIAKVSRLHFIRYFNDVFDALCKLSADADPMVQNAAHLLDRLVKDIVTESEEFSVEKFIPVLRERLSVPNPYVRQFLVGWVTVLDSVPDINMLAYLPDFLDGLFNMLSDSNREIRLQADSALGEFLQEIKSAPSVAYGRLSQTLVSRALSSDEFTQQTAITWLREFVHLAGKQLFPYYPSILGALLASISTKSDNISQLAVKTNSEMREQCLLTPAEFDATAILAVAQREMKHDWEHTRLEAMKWISALLQAQPQQVFSKLDDLFASLLGILADPSDQVVLGAVAVLAALAQDEKIFRALFTGLLAQFKPRNAEGKRLLLEKRGSLVLRRFCVVLDAERVYRELAAILTEEEDVEFADVMVQALNIILLTSEEAAPLRAALRQSLHSAQGASLLTALYTCWCHSPVAAIALCLLAQAYPHASSIITRLGGQSDLSVGILVQVDRLVHLIESPTFTYLRLQLLEPNRHPFLMKTLYGLLMLLPQSEAFRMLRTRLKSIPTYTFMHLKELATSPSRNVVSDAASPGEDHGDMEPNLNFSQLLRHYDFVQQKHRLFDLRSMA